MRFIILLIFIWLAWRGIIPVRFWYAKSRGIYEGKKTRFVIRCIKWIDRIRDWFDQFL